MPQSFVTQLNSLSRETLFIISAIIFTVVLWTVAMIRSQGLPASLGSDVNRTSQPLYDLSQSEFAFATAPFFTTYGNNHDLLLLQNG